MNGEDHLDVSSSVENVVSNPDDCHFCFVVCGCFWYQLVVGLQASRYALGLYVVPCCVSVGPLLQSWFAWQELIVAHRTGSARALAVSLTADHPFAASASDVSSWCSDVVRVGA